MSSPKIRAERTPTNDYIGSFLATRNEKTGFTMAEFGHYDTPTLFQQPKPFIGNRVAIGIETWFRDSQGKAREAVRKQEESDRLKQNIVFLEYTAGLSIIRDSLGRIIASEGEYLPETILPDKAVDEIFLSNVFGDEHLAESDENTHRMLAEISRLLDDEGYVVIRETINPRANPFLSKGLFEQVGLELKVIIVPDHKEDWKRLEAIYNAETAHASIMPFSFYMILSKQRKENAPKLYPQDLEQVDEDRLALT